MKSIKLSAFILSLTLLLTSCLKDDKYALDPSQGSNVVEFLNVIAPSSGYNDPFLVYTKTFDASAESIFTAGVNYAGPENVAPQDIVISLAASAAVITTHNTAKAANLTQLDPSLYSFPATVTIKKGEKKALFDIKLKTEDFDFSKANALAISITNTSHAVISGNGGAAIFVVPVKNVYDGVYKLEPISPMVDVTNPALTGYYPIEAGLVTQLERSSAMNSITYLNGQYTHPIKNGANNSNYGNFGPVFIFDEAHNVIEVVNYFGQGTNANGRSAKLDPTGINKFTFNSDGSKTLEVKYIMVENGNNRTTFNEKWTYVRSR